MSALVTDATTARHAARVFALFLLLQLEANSTLSDATVIRPDEAKKATIGVIQSLRQFANEQLEAARTPLQEAVRSIADIEFEHPDNLEKPIGSPTQSVTLPKSKALGQQLDTCLGALEALEQAIRLPELLWFGQVSEEQEALQQFMVKIANTVIEHVEHLDTALGHYSEGWKLDRLIRIDRMILRMALAELLYIDSIEIKVSIDQAIELAKTYSTDDSYRFINGLLGKLVDEIEAGTLTKAPVAGAAH